MSTDAALLAECERLQRCAATRGRPHLADDHNFCCNSRFCEYRRQREQWKGIKSIQDKLGFLPSEYGPTLSLTFTFAHDCSQGLREQLDFQAKALATLEKSREFKRLTYGFCRVSETTYREPGYWHVHTHMLLLTRNGVGDLGEIIHSLSALWVKVLSGLGSTGSIHAVPLATKKDVRRWLRYIFKGHMSSYSPLHQRKLGKAVSLHEMPYESLAEYREAMFRRRTRATGGCLRGSVACHPDVALARSMSRRINSYEKLCSLENEELSEVWRLSELILHRTDLSSRLRRLITSLKIEAKTLAQIRGLELIPYLTLFDGRRVQILDNGSTYNPDELHLEPVSQARLRELYHESFGRGKSICVPTAMPKTP